MGNNSYITYNNMKDIMKHEQLELARDFGSRRQRAPAWYADYYFSLIRHMLGKDKDFRRTSEKPPRPC
jgi:hypothetical protein